MRTGECDKREHVCCDVIKQFCMISEARVEKLVYDALVSVMDRLIAWLHHTERTEVATMSC